MKIVTFRPSGFADNPLVGIGAAEVSDLTAETLGRLVVDMRHRITIRETLATAERLWWSTSVSMACWTAVLTMAVEELHSRALVDHVARYGQRLDEATAKAAATAGLGKLSVYGETFLASLTADSQGDNALAAERCESKTPWGRPPGYFRCMGATGHNGRHFSGPRAARTWWA